MLELLFMTMKSKKQKTGIQNGTIHRSHSSPSLLQHRSSKPFPSLLSFIQSLFSFTHTSYRCRKVDHRRPIPKRDLIEEHGPIFYDTPHDFSRRRVNLNTHPLFTEQGQEIPIYNSDGDKINRTIPYADEDEGQCGVLMDLDNIHALFNPDSQLHALEEQEHEEEEHEDEDVIPEESHFTHVDAYPLAFLKSIGNIQASGVPHCFGPTITAINQNILSIHPDQDSHDSDHGSDRMSIIEDHPPASPAGSQVLRPVASQFYNYIAHRTAAKAGSHYSQRGTVTAAIAGAFADGSKHKTKASDLQNYCKQCLPFERFHKAISLEDCPSCCRAELVYSVDVRALPDCSGR
jgi:hypothetical protein